MLAALLHGTGDDDVAPVLRLVEQHTQLVSTLCREVRELAANQGPFHSCTSSAAAALVVLSTAIEAEASFPGPGLEILRQALVLEELEECLE